MTESKKRVSLTWEELSKHNTENDCWIAIRGKIYDVTHWIHKHPGGKDNLLLNGGRDATQLFESYHPIRVHSMLEKFEIGDLTTFEYPQFPPMSPLFLDIKKGVESYFEQKGIRGQYAPEILFRSFMLVTVMLLCHYLSVIMLMQNFPFIVAGFFAVIVGICAAIISFTPVHEASHSATTDSPFIWRLLGATHDYVNGASFYTWLHQHFLGHHPFTNVTAQDFERYGPSYSLDPDTITGEKDIRRIKPHQKWYSWYRNQHIYVPLLYGLLGIKYRINDMIILHSLHKNGEIRMNPPGLWHSFHFYVGKFFWLYYRIILPIYYIGAINTMLLFLLSDFITGWMLAFIFQVNHVIPQAIWPKIENDRVNIDWALLQIQTTMDYAHDSYLTTFITGALNYQVVHHLVPYVSQIHYPKIAPIIKEVCKKHGVQYNYLPTFYDALKNHLNYLKIMGNKESGL